MARKSALGTGFEALIPTTLEPDEFDPTSETDVKISTLIQIPLEQIFPDSNQPRRRFDKESLNELAESIREHGVLQPIVVVRRDRESFTLVAGERRWRAAKIANLKTIPALLRSMSDQNRLELSIIENAQREDLNAVELATAYEKLRSQFNLSVKEIAHRVGKSSTTITNTLRLLELPEAAKKMMLEHRISEGVARPLVNLSETDAIDTMRKIIAYDWTAREVEQYIATHKRRRSSTVALRQQIFRRQEARLREKFGVKVRINNRSITFPAKNETELKELIKKLGVV